MFVCICERVDNRPCTTAEEKKRGVNESDCRCKLCAL